MAEVLRKNIDTEPAPFSYTTQEYTDLVRAVDEAFEGNHEITYVPFTDEQRIEGLEHLHYMDREGLNETMARADIIICIGRDEELNPDYTDQYPEHNIILPPSARSNVDTCVELFKLAQKNENGDVAMIVTGRVNNRQIRMILALPLIAELIGIRAEDAYHIPEAQFEKRLEALTPEFIDELLRQEPEDDELAANYRALKSFLSDENPIQEIMRAYRDNPRMPESRLMLERAAKAGVPLENLHEEDGSVDTISSLVNVGFMLDSMSEFHKDRGLRVVIVAGSDHLPRTSWLADHILPDDVEITCVESDPALSEEGYIKSCERERLSFLKGSKWISGTRKLDELDQIVEAGYFGANYKDAKQIAREVAEQKASTGQR